MNYDVWYISISRQGMRKKYTYNFEQKICTSFLTLSQICETYWFMSYIGSSRSIYINNMLMQLKYDDGPEPIWTKWFTSLKADFHLENGTFPWSWCTWDFGKYLIQKRIFLFVTLLIWVNVRVTNALTEQCL